MSESKSTVEMPKAGSEVNLDRANPVPKPAWETPKLEDVSEQVMAQPYIRFT